MASKGYISQLFKVFDKSLRIIMVLAMAISPLAINIQPVSASTRVMCENDASLVGCWRMEEGSGGILQDGGASPFNDVSLVASPTWVSGKVGNYAIGLMVLPNTEPHLMKVA